MYFTKWFHKSKQVCVLETLLIVKMPGKKGLTSKDFQGPLRKPGEKGDTSTTEDGGVKESSSAPEESEKGVTFTLLLKRIVNLGISATVACC